MALEHMQGCSLRSSACNGAFLRLQYNAPATGCRSALSSRLVASYSRSVLIARRPRSRTTQKWRPWLWSSFQLTQGPLDGMEAQARENVVCVVSHSALLVQRPPGRPETFGLKLCLAIGFDLASPTRPALYVCLVSVGGSWCHRGFVDLSCCNSYMTCSFML